MALIKCPECGKDVSTSASACPHCGYPINGNKPQQSTSYDTQVVKIRCLGRSTKALNDKLEPYTSQGWEVVSMVEDNWQGGLASPVYKVTMRRPQSVFINQLKKANKNAPKTWKCKVCGHENSYSDEYCVKCLADMPK